MQTARTDPSYIPVRRGGWPTRRSPRWAFAAAAILLAIAVAVGLSHRPTTGQRATDLRTFLNQVTSDIQSCSGGVGESLFVLRRIDSGASHDVGTAIGVASTGAVNCSPANNELLGDLTSIQVPESLSSYHLQAAVAALIDWAAPDAAQVQADVATILKDRGKPSEPAARAALSRDLRRLDAQRQVVFAALAPAIRALSPQSRPPVLHG